MIDSHLSYCPRARTAIELASNIANTELRFFILSIYFCWLTNDAVGRRLHRRSSTGSKRITPINSAVNTQRLGLRPFCKPMRRTVRLCSTNSWSQASVADGQMPLVAM